MKQYTNSEVSKLIEEHIHSERDRRILKARLIDGLTFDELSSVFNISERQLKRIVYKAQDMIFQLL